jgi:tetratricopeptide (TPR) repeat protein
MSKSTQHAEKQAENKIEAFFYRYKKPITYVAAAIIIVVGGWYAYQKFVAQPKEEKAQAAIFKAEEYFRADSLRKGLDGDATSKGFLYIIKTYSGTKTGNLAKFYAGVSYLRLGEFDNAIKYLDDFSTDSKQIQALAWQRLGDAYSEKGNKSKAVDLYKKAGRHFELDEINSSESLFRAAQLLESENKPKEAVEIYKELKEKFPKTDKGGQAERYIYRLEIQKNEFSVN